jgi:Fibronectin type III domain
VSRHRTARRLIVSAGALGLLVASTIAASPAQAAPDVVYDGIGSPLPSNVGPSFGFDATGFNEFGDLVTLAPGPRGLTTVSVALSSQACETGSGTPTCTTTPGATFTHPLTMTLYNMAGTLGAPTVGPVIATLTDTFTIPFRPSADPVHCTGANARRWFDGTACLTGITKVVDFAFPPGTVLPDTLIWAISYNTEHHGHAPIGVDGPYDYLNVGTASVNPTIGTDVDEDMVFVSDAATGDVLASDTGWTGFRPMAQIGAQVTVPDAPTGLTAMPGDGKVTLSWTAPPDGGAPITGYVIGGGGTCTPSPATATTCVVSGLTNGVPVSFTVAAVNSAGTGPAATSPTVTPVAPTTTTTTTSITTTAPTTTLSPGTPSNGEELAATGGGTWPLTIAFLAVVTGVALVLLTRRRHA